MMVIIAILLLTALAEVYMLFQSAKGGFPDTSRLNVAPAAPSQAPAQVPPAIECSGNGQQNCTIDGCPGTLTCYGGGYGVCQPKRKICVPGEKIGCSTDACKFGYAVCNSCGTGYSECLPRPIYNATNSTPPCTSSSCN